ncbi:aryl-alcohol dehydrogenase [NADP+] [Cyathus striatus]|nr:aryl-alcohol dehydrogenase [NADP+] [Cyathus striatus]
MSLFSGPPPPASSLGRYRLLSPNAGVHVSPIQLGAMSLGDKWGGFGMGSMSKDESFELLDAYLDLGGNFIDTASKRNRAKRSLENGRRNEEYYTGNFKLTDPSVKQKVLCAGNNSKALHITVEASLKKLRTSYIDLLYVHFWDYNTSIEEVMRSLNTLVQQRKVLYLGVSDTPAWVVSRANQYARDHALTPFVVYQGCWNVLERSFEREIIPMARAEGMALAPWRVLASGKIRSDAEEERRKQSGENGRIDLVNKNWERNEKEKLVCKALEKVAEEVGTKSITAVAIAYVMQKTPFVFPIIGGRKIEHLKENLEALEIALSKEQIKYIESIVPFDLGFPAG